MDTIQIEGIRPYDGDWPFDLNQQPFTTREWGWIKRLSGYLPNDVEAGVNDPEFVTVLALIALHRAGKVETVDVATVFDRLQDVPFGGAIRWKVGQQEEAAEEPVPPQTSSNENAGTSGPDSQRSSEISLVHPKPFGTPGSDTSESPQEMSAS